MLPFACAGNILESWVPEFCSWPFFYYPKFYHMCHGLVSWFSRLYWFYMKYNSSIIELTSYIRMVCRTLLIYISIIELTSYIWMVCRTLLICSCSEGVMVIRTSSLWVASSTAAAMASILSCLSSRRLKQNQWSKQGHSL